MFFNRLCLAVLYIYICFCLQLSGNEAHSLTNEEVKIVQPLSSLLFYLDQYQNKLGSLNSESSFIDYKIEPLHFHENDVNALWDQISLFSQGILDTNHQEIVLQSLEKYKCSKILQNQNQLLKAQALVKQAYEDLYCVWINTQNLDTASLSLATDLLLQPHLNKNRTEAYLDNNRYISKKAKNEMRPYVLPSYHVLN